MPIARLMICQWSGVERSESVIASPSWHVVAHAVGVMDLQQGHDLYLYPDLGEAASHLAIHGGGGRYLVRGASGARRRIAVDPARWSAGTLSVIAEGQLGDYPSHWVVDLATVIAAARVYWSRAGYSSDVCWEDAAPEGCEVDLRDACVEEAASAPQEKQRPHDPPQTHEAEDPE